MKRELQELIECLSPEELDEARSYIDYRHSKAAAGEVSAKDYRYWQALCEVLKGGESNLRNFIYGQGKQKGFGIKNYRAVLVEIDQYIASGCGAVMLSRAEHKQLIIECFRALADRCHHVGAPVTHAVLLVHARVSLAAAMEWRYPGYSGAQLLHLIVRHIRNSVDVNA